MGARSRIRQRFPDAIEEVDWHFPDSRDEDSWYMANLQIFANESDKEADELADQVAAIAINEKHEQPE
jgi:hypothetical protein